jgi:Holliday junction DNA helicase RuvA
MYAYLKGRIERVAPCSVELDVNGVGYEVAIPLSTYSRLPGQDGTVKLFTHMHVREDVMSLFGFLTLEERELFRLLLTVSGIGPKVALSVLSHMNPEEFLNAVRGHDVDALTRVSGVGKKSAQRVILELKSRVGEDAELDSILGLKAEAPSRTEVVQALIALGCRQKEAVEAARKAEQELPVNTSIEELVKGALKHI